MKIDFFYGLCIILIWLGNAHGYNILGVFHTGGKSHYIVGSALMKGLAEAGHNVSFKFSISIH